jgi:hypothetical protein
VFGPAYYRHVGFPARISIAADVGGGDDLGVVPPLAARAERARMVSNEAKPYPAIIGRIL